MSSVRQTKKFKVPHAWVIIFMIIVMVAILTYIVPAGEFERTKDPTTGRIVVVPDSFHYVESSPVGFLDTFVAIQKGMIDAASIVSLIFIAYAYMFTVIKTGALRGLIGKMVEVTKGKDFLLFVIPVIFFGLLGSTAGFGSEVYGFIPVFISLTIALGYDALVGFSLVYLATLTGFAAATINPFTVGLAQEIVGLPLFSGLGYRIVIFVFYMALVTWWTLRYAKRVKEDPDRSIVKGIYFGAFEVTQEELSMEYTTRHKIITGLLALSLFVIVVGSLKFGWGLDEMAGIFILFTIITGLVAGFGPNQIAETFIEGCSQVVNGALICGVARAILVILQEGNIIDSVIYGLSQPLTLFPSWLCSVGMVAVQTLINFFIPSGTGQAAVTMPIFAPIADMLGITRQTAVLAFHFGDGFTNMFWPTTALPAALGIAKIPLERWYKYFAPLMLIYFIFNCIFVTIAHFMNYGPF